MREKPFYEEHVEFRLKLKRRKLRSRLKSNNRQFLSNSLKNQLDTNGKFDAVEITYANTDEGLNLIMMITNSKADTPPNGK